MKNILLFLLIICATMSSFVYGDSRTVETEEVVTSGHVDAKGLKALMDTGASFVLLDARGDKWNDNAIIPGAHLAWHEDDEFKMIPHKDALVIVYCYSWKCPYAPKLVKKLIKLGFENVVEYSAGLKDWRDIAGYPVDTIE